MAVTQNFRFYKKIFSAHKNLHYIFQKCNDVCETNCFTMQKRNFTIQEEKPYACKVAVVIGGGRETGYHIVEELLRGGAKGVIVGDIVDEVTTNLKRKFRHGKILFRHCDVSNKDDIENIFKNAIETFDKVNIVVNNASVTADAKWEDNVAVNVRGVVYGTLLGIQHMSTRNCGEGGIIINKSSIFGLQPYYPFPIYTGSNHFIVGFTRSMGNSYFYSHSHVKVMAFCPCAIKKLAESDLKEDQLGRFANLEKEEEKQMGSLACQESQECGKLIRAMIKAEENGSIWVVDGSEIYKLCMPDWQSYNAKKQQIGLRKLQSYRKPPEKSLRNTSDQEQSKEFANKSVQQSIQISEDLSKSISIQHKSRDDTSKFEEMKGQYEINTVIPRDHLREITDSFKDKQNLCIYQGEATKPKQPFKIENDTYKAGEDTCKDDKGYCKSDPNQPKEETYILKEDRCKLEIAPEKVHACLSKHDLFTLKNVISLPKEEWLKAEENLEKSELKHIFTCKNDKTEVIKEQNKNKFEQSESNPDLLIDPCIVKDDPCEFKGQAHITEENSLKSIENLEKSREETLKTKEVPRRIESQPCKSKNYSNQTESGFYETGEDSCKPKSDSSIPKGYISKTKEYTSNADCTKTEKDTKEEDNKSKEDFFRGSNGIWETNHSCKLEGDPWKIEEAGDIFENGFEEVLDSKKSAYKAKDDPCKSKDNKIKDVWQIPGNVSTDLRADPHKCKTDLSKLKGQSCKPTSNQYSSQGNYSQPQDLLSEIKKVKGIRKKNKHKIRSDQRKSSKKVVRHKHKRIKL